MIDRTFNLLVLCLAGALLALVGVFLATVSDSPPPPGPAPRAATEPASPDVSPNDLATKRVKTITVRPEELYGAPRIP